MRKTVYNSPQDILQDVLNNKCLRILEIFSTTGGNGVLGIKQIIHLQKTNPRYQKNFAKLFK